MAPPTRSRPLPLCVWHVQCFQRQYQTMWFFPLLASVFIVYQGLASTKFDNIEAPGLYTFEEIFDAALSQFFDFVDDQDQCPIICLGESAKLLQELEKLVLFLEEEKIDFVNDTKIHMMCNDFRILVNCTSLCENRPWKRRLLKLYEAGFYVCDGSDFMKHLDCYCKVFRQVVHECKNRCLYSNMFMKRRIFLPEISPKSSCRETKCRWNCYLDDVDRHCGSKSSAVLREIFRLSKSTIEYLHQILHGAFVTKSWNSVFDCEFS